VLVDYLEQGGKWTAMAWWIHDHLSYGSMCFFSQLGAFNLGWHENPGRRIDSYAVPKGCLVKPGIAVFDGSHEGEYSDLLTFVEAWTAPASPSATRSQEIPGNNRRLLKSHASAEITSIMIPVGAKKRGSRPVKYRAVHTRNGWRRASHESLKKEFSETLVHLDYFLGRSSPTTIRMENHFMQLLGKTAICPGKLLVPIRKVAAGLRSPKFQWRTSTLWRGIKAALQTSWRDTSIFRPHNWMYLTSDKK
jgi:hypothetical protein